MDVSLGICESLALGHEKSRGFAGVVYPRLMDGICWGPLC